MSDEAWEMEDGSMFLLDHDSVFYEEQCTTKIVRDDVKGWSAPFYNDLW